VLQTTQKRPGWPHCSNDAADRQLRGDRLAPQEASLAVDKPYSFLRYTQVMPENQRAPRLPAQDRGLLSVTWPMIVIAVLMLSMCVASLSLLSSIRAFVNGEGMWSKAERQAIAELREYARSGEPDNYRRFRAELAVTLGDYAARLQLQSAGPDYPLAAQGLLAGRNHADDIPGMMRLFRWFRGSPLLAEPVSAWTRADELIAKLEQVGVEIHAAIESKHSAPGALEQLATDAEVIHHQVAPLEDEFSTSLGRTSRLVYYLLSAVLALCSATLVVFGLIISHKTIRRSDRLARELRVIEEQAFVAQARSHVTLASIADAVLCTNLANQVTYMNGAAEALTGWSNAEATQQPIHTVLNIVSEPHVFSITCDIAQILSGEQRTGSATGSILKRRDGSTVAVHEHGSPIRDSHNEVIGIVFVLRDITQERAFSTQLHHQATHDALTGLANRREFERRLQHAIDDRQRAGTNHALLYVDLDQFKVVNDTCGHAAGDQLLCQVSSAVKQRLRSGDLLARLGGDEFGILLAHCTAADAMSLAELIRQRISEQRFPWKDKLFTINASIGVLCLTDHQTTVDDAMSAADQACYLAKDNGRNRVQLYRPDDQEMRARHGEMQWVERITAALELDRFVLFAQEIRPLATWNSNTPGGEPPHLEILVRMLDADGALISPMAFIPAAERYGLMPRIDRWVIARACKTLAECRIHFGKIPTCMINLSGGSVTDSGIVDFIRARLLQYSLPGDRVGFELTETAAIGNLSRAAELMGQLRELRCPLSLDDFGSGMSSFGYLRNLPVEYLKIDGEFVKDMATDNIDYAVVEAIFHIGKVMGIKTVAESVENAETLSALKQIGVDFAQGYHLARPMPMTEAIARMVDDPSIAAASESIAAAGSRR
jgi:diguanylate cyclase (GGDEF)-like protein/PAS domain S-box-containing protein